MCKHNTEARVRIHCCCGKAIRITYSECVFVALLIQIYNILSRGLIETSRFSGEKIKYKMCFLISSATIFQIISHFKENSAGYSHKIA